MVWGKNVHRQDSWGTDDFKYHGQLALGTPGFQGYHFNGNVERRGDYRLQ